MNKNNELVMTDEEKYGVQAIIFLQALVGINESEEVALKNWQNFQQREKESTINIYKLFMNEEE